MTTTLTAVEGAAADLEQIKARMAAGERVTATQFAGAENALAFARAQDEAAERAAAERQRRERESYLEALMARVRGELDPALLDESRQQMAAVIEAHVAACGAFRDRYAELWAEVSALGEGEAPGLRADSGGIHLNGQLFRSARPQVDINAAAMPLLQAHYPRTQINLGNPQD
jgi:hypothetical protein